MSKNEDDFWNTSSSSAFNFDDDDDEYIGQTSETSLFQSAPDEVSVLPIHNIISKVCLDLVLDDIKSTNDVIQPPVEETVLKIVHGHKFNLSCYKKINDKILLLENALQTFNGNVILNVILFLKQTLNSNIFLSQLAKRKNVVKFYSYYLIVNNQLGELADLYMATGNSNRMRQIFYMFHQELHNKEALLKKQDQFMRQHLQKAISPDDHCEISNNIRFLTWQNTHKSNANSVIEQLAELCKTEAKVNTNFLESLLIFKTEFKIDDMTFEWTLMNVLASMEMWPQLQNIFIKSNWFTKKNVLKTSLNTDTFIYGLSKHNPPKNVVEQYLVYISESAKALNIAKKLQCNNFIISHYLGQRDRLALISFKEKLVPQTQEYFLAESALQTKDKKWKN